MSLAVRCPNSQCNRLVRVSSELRGQRIACPACGAALRIPAARVSQTAPAPANLDDTPPELEAITEGTASETPVKAKAAKAGDMSERVADTAASATSAVAPVIKLLVALVFLGGLVWVSTKYLFPAMWAKKPISSGTVGDLTRQEDEARRLEKERKDREKPLDDPTRAAITAAIESGDMKKARSLIQTLKAGGAVAATDLRAMEVAFQDALARQVGTRFERIDDRLSASAWDEVDVLLGEVRDLDSAAGNSERFKNAEQRARGGRVAALLANADEQVAAEDYDAAMATLERARAIDKSDRRIDEQRRQSARLMQSGIQFKVAGGVKADVYVDGKRLGDTSRTVWKLPPQRRLTFILKAPGHVPREVRETLNPDVSKAVTVELALPVSDALWAAHVLKDDASRWLVCKALGGEDPSTAAYVATLESRCKGAKPNEKKRVVFHLVRKDRTEIDVLEYTALGNTVRYVELTTGKTVRGAKEDVVTSERLDLETGARRWLAALGSRAGAAADPCAAVKILADFVELYPDRIDLVLNEHRDQLTQWGREIAGLASCSEGATRRDDLDLSKRIAAELAVWKAVGIKPPDVLVQQSKAAP